MNLDITSGWSKFRLETSSAKQISKRMHLIELEVHPSGCSMRKRNSALGGPCEHGNVPSGFIKSGEFLDLLSDC
jgi:hypothetical protein